MDYETKFPIEHFNEIMANDAISSALTDLVNRIKVNPLQPALFTDEQWKLILADYIQANNNPDIYKILAPLVAWGFTKNIYNCSKEFLWALAVSDYDEIDDMFDRLFKFNGCAYFNGEWFWHPELQVNGWWMTIVNHGDNTGLLRVVLNTAQGLINQDVLVDERGLYNCLIDAVPGMPAHFENGSDNDETDEKMLIYSGSVNAARLAHYLMSDNAEVCGNIKSYELNEATGELSIPVKMAIANIGIDAGKRVAQAEAEGVVKPAHWKVDSNATVRWLCGHESESDDLMDCQHTEFDWSDQDLVEMNQGRHEDNFVIPLKELGPMSDQDSPGWEKLRAEGIEMIHGARARVAAAEGRVYDKCAEDGEPIDWSSIGHAIPPSPLTEKFGKKLH